MQSTGKSWSLLVLKRILWSVQTYAKGNPMEERPFPTNKKPISLKLESSPTLIFHS